VDEVTDMKAQTPRGGGRVAFATIVFILVVGQVAPALADNTIADGDGMAPIANNDLSFGDVCAGATASRVVPIVVTRQGSGVNTFKNGASVAVTQQSLGTNDPDGTLSTSPTTAIGTIVLPSDWETSPNNTQSSSVSVTVTLVAGGSAASFSQTMTVRGSGLNTSNSTINRDDGMTVTANIVTCDSAAPVVTVSAPSAGTDGYFNASEVPVTVNVSATDPSGVTSIACVDGATPVTVTQSGSNPRTGWFQLSGDGAHNISCTATDTLGNGGAGAGSSNTASVLIDSVAPSVSCGTSDGSWHGDDVSIACTASDPAGSGLSSAGDASFSLTTNVPAGTETSNASTGTRVVADVAGNTATAGPVADNKVDRKPPELEACDTPDTAWHGSNQSFACTYTDGGSGAGTLSVVLSTDVAAGDETASATASAGGAQASDAVGNLAATPADIIGVMVDRKAPEQTICDVADGIWHAGNVTLFCTYTDGGIGPAGQAVSLTTTVAAGQEDGDAAASAGGAQACDDLGNCAPSPADIAGNKVDRKAPQLSVCDDPTDWSPVNVALSCIYTDGGSGPATQGVDLVTDVPGGSETANASASAGGAQACDDVGNCATSPDDITGNRIDRRSPAVTCGSADGLWHGSQVSIPCSATDGGSGLADSTDASFDLTTSVPDGTEDPDASTDSRDIYDVVGNLTVAGPVDGNQIDLLAPAITCGAVPSGWQSNNVTILCTAVDGGSGLADAGDASFGLSTSVAAGDEDALATTGDRTVCDGLGNCATAGPFLVQVDRKAPSFVCADPDGVWHPDNVSLACTSTDDGSGLAQAADAAFSLSTTVAADAETDDAQTGSRQLCDAVGNCVTAGPIGGNQVDRKVPELDTCDVADGMWHSDNVTLSCSYTDGGSGPGDLSVDLMTNVADGDETDDAFASAGGAFAVDAVGNAAGSPSDIGGNKVDRKAPQLLSCESPDGIWHANNQSFTCTYSDGGSGAGTLEVVLSTSVADGDETDNAIAAAGGAFAVDAVGNAAATPSDITGVMVDRKVPQLSGCDAPDGAWHAMNVTLLCIYTDGGSGPSTITVPLTTSVAGGVETANAMASAGGAVAQDSVGNAAASPADIGGNKVDRKVPGVTFVTPNGAGSSSFVLGEAVPSSYSCNDGGSGTLICLGPAMVDTSTVGSHGFMVGVQDMVGNAGSASTTYAVVYSTGSCLGSAGHQVLQPVNADGSSAFKKGSTVPIKFRVCDASGASIGTPGVVSQLRAMKKVSGTVESTVLESIVSTTPDTSFRWDATAQQWIFNLNTKNLTGGYTYFYAIDLNDGSTIEFHFYLKN
jgi:hypothetical protein